MKVETQQVNEKKSDEKGVRRREKVRGVGGKGKKKDVKKERQKK